MDLFAEEPDEPGEPDEPEDPEEPEDPTAHQRPESPGLSVGPGDDDDEPDETGPDPPVADPPVAENPEHPTSSAPPTTGLRVMVPLTMRPLLLTERSASTGKTDTLLKNA